jgi:hypothetical protein
MRNEYRILVGKPEEAGPQEVLDVSRRIILKWILEKKSYII